MATEQLGRCDFKQYEHCGLHECIPDVGQRFPPFGCKNWRGVEPVSATPEALAEARELKQSLLEQMFSREDSMTPKYNPKSTLPMPTNEESVAWAEEADKLANALHDLLNVIEADDLIPESVSYMRQAREVLELWPTREETEAAKDRIWQRIKTTS